MIQMSSVYDLLLKKNVTVKINSKRRIYIFAILLLIAFVVVVFRILQTSCAYHDSSYSGYCDPMSLQINQYVSFCKNNTCYDTSFYSSNNTIYTGTELSNCVVNMTQMKVIIVGEFPSWTASKNSISCNDNLRFFIRDISTETNDPVNRIMYSTVQSLIGEYGLGSTMLLNIYNDANGYHFVADYFNNTQQPVQLTSNPLANFQKGLTDIINGSIISFGYTCHNCFLGGGPFNGNFLNKFFTSLFSIMGFITSVLTIACTMRITSDHFELGNVKG